MGPRAQRPPAVGGDWRALTIRREQLLEPCPRNNPQVTGEIRAEDTHITHANTMKPISFWCSKLGCIFWLYSSVYIDLLHGK
jgi:hypothetical protein